MVNGEQLLKQKLHITSCLTAQTLISQVCQRMRTPLAARHTGADAKGGGGGASAGGCTNTGVEHTPHARKIMAIYQLFVCLHMEIQLHLCLRCSVTCESHPACDISVFPPLLSQWEKKIEFTWHTTHQETL